MKYTTDCNCKQQIKELKPVEAQIIKSKIMPKR